MSWQRLYANPVPVTWVKQGNKLVCGLCYEWAYRDVQDHGGVLVQGTVTEPLSSPPSKYLHAWVERGGKVYDWQTMVQGQGGKFRGRGFPRKIFYELFQPERMKRYDDEQAMIALVRHRHYGPWE